MVLVAAGLKRVHVGNSDLIVTWSHISLWTETAVRSHIPATSARLLAYCSTSCNARVKARYIGEVKSQDIANV
jgi:hypothetical protein